MHTSSLCCQQPQAVGTLASATGVWLTVEQPLGSRVRGGQEGQEGLWVRHCLMWSSLSWGGGMGFG